MIQSIKPLPGISDIFPEESREWRVLERYTHEIFSRYGYGEIRTPILERAEVFDHTIGEQTDIVQKEMYTFTDRGNRRLTLRPEGTAGVLRALIAKGITPEEEARVYYMGPMFRGERPAAGRKRQFHQIGSECISKDSPEVDAECIMMLLHFLESIGLSEGKLLLNTRGAPEEQKTILHALYAYFSAHDESLCKDCKNRLQKNVWRILDCKNNACRQVINAAPAILDLLGEEGRDYFAKLCRYLDHLNIPYCIDPRLVRGLDYYFHTVFEVVSDNIGAQNALAGGGRYALQFPGHRRPIRGVGFALGIERLLMLKKQKEISDKSNHSLNVYVISLGEEALKENFRLTEILRKKGISAQMNMIKRGIKAQLRTANKLGVNIALIRGEDELHNNTVICKDMKNSTEKILSLDDCILQAPTSGFDFSQQCFTTGQEIFSQIANS